MRFDEQEYLRLADLESKHWENIAFKDENILCDDKVFLQWGNHPVVKVYSNIVQTGNAAKDWLDFLCDHFTKFKYGCSIGCGSGWVERILLKNDVINKLDGYDISEGAIDEANRSNEYGGRLRFFARDCNKLDLDANKYDLILFHHSFHHLLELEHVVSAVERSLTPEGLIILVDYIGETRGRWSEGKIELCRYLLELMPPGVFKNISQLDDDFFRDNPFEMIRSAEILPLMNSKFKAIWQATFAGVLYPLNNTIVSAIERRHLDKYILLACIFDLFFHEAVDQCFTFSLYVKRESDLELGIESIKKDNVLDMLMQHSVIGPPERGGCSEPEELRLHLMTLEEENKKLNEQLRAVYSTVGWNLLNNARRFRNRYLPAGSVRADIYEKLLRLLKLKHEKS
jgi:SAM-dependent methyltransferase